MKWTSIPVCLGVVLLICSATGQAQVRDTLPLRGRIRIGLADGWMMHGERGLFLSLVTEDEYPNTGYQLAAVVTRSPGLRRIEVGGAYRSSYPAGDMLAPADFTEAADLYMGRAPDTLEIAYQRDVDRYLVWRTATHAFIRPLHSSFTVLPADSLELVVPGIVMVECTPGGYPPEDCEEFLSGLVTIGTSAELLDPAQDLATRVFGNTLSAGDPRIIRDPRARSLVARGVVESEVQSVLERALAFLGARAGHAPPAVTLRAWDGRVFTCYSGACRRS